MDDLFGMLYSDLEPKKKLLTAVTSNMVDSVDKLVAGGGIDLDQPLHHHNGNCALHIAAMNGHQACVQKLLDLGANPDATNRFGFTPLATALRRSGHSKCVQTLLTHGSPSTDMDLIWNSSNMDGSRTWLGYNIECMKVLFNATPCFLQYFATDEERFLHVLKQNIELIRMYCLCGNKFTDSQRQSIMVGMDDDGKKWIKEFGKCRSLQHYARCEIRRNLQRNVFYASRNLPIPPTIQEYLIITDLDNCRV